jgi:hypothetical protein
VDRVAKIFGGGLVLALLSQVIFVWWLGDSDMYLKSADAGKLGKIFLNLAAIFRILISFGWLLTIFITVEFVFRGFEGLKKNVFQRLNADLVKELSKNIMGNIFSALFLLLVFVTVVPIAMFGSGSDLTEKSFRAFVYMIIFYAQMVYSELKSSAKVSL